MIKVTFVWNGSGSRKLTRDTDLKVSVSGWLRVDAEVGRPVDGDLADTLALHRDTGRVQNRNLDGTAYEYKQQA